MKRNVTPKGGNWKLGKRRIRRDMRKYLFRIHWVDIRNELNGVVYIKSIWKMRSLFNKNMKFRWGTMNAELTL